MTRPVCGKSPIARVLALTSAFVLVGCEGPVQRIQASASAPAQVRSAAAPVHRLTGGGKIDLSAFELFPETYTFSASADGDGNVRGQAQIRLSDPLVSFHAEISCLAVDGNSAWVGGSVVQSSDAGVLPLGTQFWTRVQDNGESEASPPDRIGFVRLGASAAVCNERRPVQMPFLFTKGNLTVR